MDTKINARHQLAALCRDIVPALQTNRRARPGICLAASMNTQSLLAELLGLFLALVKNVH